MHGLVCITTVACKVGVELPCRRLIFADEVSHSGADGSVERTRRPLRVLAQFLVTKARRVAPSRAVPRNHGRCSQRAGIPHAIPY